MPRFPGIPSEKIILTVAASDTPQRFKEGATYFCDGTADETEINAALTQAALEGSSGALGSTVLLLPGTYTISTPVLISNPKITLEAYGNLSSTTAEIRSTAATAGIKITAARVTVRGLAVYNTAGYGIEFDATSGSVAYSSVQECNIHNCGSFGIYGHGTSGVYSLIIDKCYISNNTTAEVKIVGTSTEPNGSSIHITSCQVGGTAARGLWLNGNGILISGCGMEAGSGGNIGIEIGGEASLLPSGITIIGNYFEAWSHCAIRFGDSGASTTSDAASTNATGFLVSGNFFNIGVSTANGIQLSQTLAGFVIGNRFTSDGTGKPISSITTTANTIIGPIQTDGALGTAAQSTFGTATLLGDYSKDSAGTTRIVLSGDVDQKGFAWTIGNPASDNFAGLTAQTGYWRLPVKAGDYLKMFSIMVYGDADDAVVVTLERLQGDIGDAWGTTWTTVTLDATSDTNPFTFSTGTGNPPNTGQRVNMLHRIESGYTYRLKTVFTPGATGTRTFYPLTMHYSTE